ncbi:hypothetical protein MLD38_016949 [Melastoma candidum]|uniref:Uncharacterized protein n=1 Tax=Melastoma candidum TaxID=119954 RepID=A0ACB9QQC9_9MYRT|nr:hypothetical protein MLD38_016949 [Melastoma candidum]
MILQRFQKRIISMARPILPQIFSRGLNRSVAYTADFLFNALYSQFFRHLAGIHPPGLDLLPQGELEREELHGSRKIHLFVSVLKKTTTYQVKIRETVGINRSSARLCKSANGNNICAV